MSGKIYKTAMGKTVDLGALMLQNENVRAVGNMNVNARGDLIDSDGNIIDPKNQQIQRQYSRMATNVEQSLPTTSNRNAKQRVATQKTVEEPVEPISPVQNALKIDIPSPTVVTNDPIVTQIDNAIGVEELPVAPVATSNPEPVPQPKPLSGLAAAIARAKTVKQPEPNVTATPDKTIRRI